MNTIVAKPGQVVLYKRQGFTPNPFELVSWPWSRRYKHVAICVGENQAISALGFSGVWYQFANGQDAVCIDVPWDFTQVQAWMKQMERDPYDWLAYVRVALRLRSDVPAHRFICSSFVGKALEIFAPSLHFVAHRETVPDDIAQVLGV